MNVEVRYFASLREALGASERVEIAAGSRLADLRDLLVARGGAYAEALGPGRSVRGARNLCLAHDAEALEDGDEVGFFPPVTGG